MESKKVVIVGAGASGLAATSKLYKSGVQDLILLEGSDRIGGRVHSVNVGYKSSKTTEAEKSHTIEYGAQWVHGVENNISYQLATSRDLLELDEANIPCNPAEFNKLTFFVDDPTLEVSVQQMEELIEEVYKNLNNVQNPDKETHGSFFNRVFWDFIQDKDESFQHQALVFKEFYHWLVRNEEGCSNWNDLSYLGSLFRYKKCFGKPRIPFKSNTKHTDLINILAEDIPAKAISLNTEVLKIIQSNNKLQVITNNGPSYEADYVIVTCSLGVLKDRAASLFEPQLPMKKLRAIQTMELGVVNKIFLEFEEPWWTGIFSKGIAFLHSDILKLKKDFGFTKEDAENDWTRFLFGAYIVDNRPRVLCCWISGEGAKKLETLPITEIQSGVMKTFRKFIGRVHSNIPEPLNVQATSWYSNPLTRGSYSYQTLASELESITPDDLAEPVGNLLFAGEATHRDYFSTVHGAIESGFREATRILSASK